VDFERKIFVKQQAAELLRSELKEGETRPSDCPRNCNRSIPAAERRFEITRAVLEELARHRALEIGIVTKSNLVTRDAEILRKIENTTNFRECHRDDVDVEMARKLEPRGRVPICASRFVS